MPPLAESPLASETVTGILEGAENLAEDKLSALETFLASLNLPEDALAGLGDGALAIAASFLVALGIDLDFTDTHFKPAGTEQASVSIRHVPKEEVECAAAPADEATVTNTDDLDTVLNEKKDGEPGWTKVQEQEYEDLNKLRNEQCPGGGMHDLQIKRVFGSLAPDGKGGHVRVDHYHEAFVYCTKCPLVYPLSEWWFFHP